MNHSKHFKLIACNVMWRELCHFAATSMNRFDFQFLPWGLHGEPDKLRIEASNDAAVLRAVNPGTPVAAEERES